MQKVAVILLLASHFDVKAMQLNSCLFSIHMSRLPSAIGVGKGYAWQARLCATDNRVQLLTQDKSLIT